MKNAIPDTERIRMMKSTGMTEKMAVMKLASMKRKPEKVSKNPKAGPMDSRDNFPYGLRVELDHEGMKKLGMKTLPKVGSKHRLMAHAHVTSSSEHQSEGDKGPRRSLSMQITHLGLAPTKASDTEDDDTQGSGLQDQ